MENNNYELDSFIDDEDDVSEQELIETDAQDDDFNTIGSDSVISPPPKKARIARVRKPKNAEPEKEPGDDTFPLNNFSLTISKCKGDVPLPLLEIFYKWIADYYTTGYPYRLLNITFTRVNYQSPSLMLH